MCRVGVRVDVRRVVTAKMINSEPRGEPHGHHKKSSAKIDKKSSAKIDYHMRCIETMRWTERWVQANQPTRRAELEYKEGLICKYETAGQVLATMRMLISGHLSTVACVLAFGLAKGWRHWDRVLRLVGRPAGSGQSVRRHGSDKVRHATGRADIRSWSWISEKQAHLFFCFCF